MVNTNKVKAVTISLLSFLSCQSVLAQTRDLSPADIFRRIRPSVVLIVAEHGSAVAQGSGFIISKDRVATNNHVMKGMTSAEVLFADGRTAVVRGIVTASSTQDIAVLDVSTGSRPTVNLGNELLSHAGDAVVAIGAPRGLELTVTNGIVSAFRNTPEKFLIQNTAPIAPGSSGGPLVNSHGQVIGITTSALTNTPGIYFSVGAGGISRLLKSSSGAVQPLGTQESATGVEPTLNETLKWLKEKIEENAGQVVHTTFVEVGTETSRSFTLLPTSAECVVTLKYVKEINTQSAEGNVPGCHFHRVKVFTETLPLSDIKDVVTSNLPGTGGIGLEPLTAVRFHPNSVSVHTSVMEKVTNCNDATYNGPHTEDTDWKDFAIAIPFRGPDSEEIVKRVAKAFEHAGSICRSLHPKPAEPF
jgi:hypothetical protein